MTHYEEYPQAPTYPFMNARVFILRLVAKALRLNTNGISDKKSDKWWNEQGIVMFDEKGMTFVPEEDLYPSLNEFSND